MLTNTVKKCARCKRMLNLKINFKQLSNGRYVHICNMCKELSPKLTLIRS
jgi:hypothetical protein